MLVRLYLSEATQGVGRTLEESVRMAEAEAQIALDLDPLNSMAHASLAWVLDHQGNAAAALAEAEIALKVNPNDSEGHLIKGHVLAMSGRFAEAQGSLSIALRLDPRGPTAPAAKHNRTVACYLARDYQAAEFITRQSIREYPDLPRAYVWRAAVLGQLGGHDASTALDKAISVAPGYFNVQDLRSGALHAPGRSRTFPQRSSEGWMGGLRSVAHAGSTNSRAISRLTR